MFGPLFRVRVGKARGAVDGRGSNVRVDVSPVLIPVAAVVVVVAVHLVGHAIGIVVARSLAAVERPRGPPKPAARLPQSRIGVFCDAFALANLDKAFQWCFIVVPRRRRRRGTWRQGCAANGLLAGIASVSKVVVHEFPLLVLKTFWVVGSMKGLPIHCHSESFTSPVALDDANRDSEPCILTRLATRNFRRHARAPRRGIVPTQRASSTRCNIAGRVVVDCRDTTTLIRVAFLTPCIIVEPKSSLHSGGFALVFADNIVVAGVATDCVDIQLHMRKLPTNWSGNAREPRRSCAPVDDVSDTIQPARWKSSCGVCGKGFAKLLGRLPALVFALDVNVSSAHPVCNIYEMRGHARSRRIGSFIQ